MLSSDEVLIVDFESKHQKAFKDLNVEWISKYFVMEDSDYKALDHAKEYIIDKGGHILIAVLGGEVVGTSALIKMDDGSYELAKMAVSPTTHGKGVGYKLGLAAIERVRQLNGSRVYLESNTILTPAINLYRKLGFIEVTGFESPYERCNIQMELLLV